MAALIFADEYAVACGKKSIKQSDGKTAGSTYIEPCRGAKFQMLWRMTRKNELQNIYIMMISGIRTLDVVEAGAMQQSSVIWGDSQHVSLLQSRVNLI
jgi:hypothetical protein